MGERSRPSIIFGHQYAYSSRFEVYIQPVHSAMSQCGSEKQRMAVNTVRHAQEKDLSVELKGQHTGSAFPSLFLLRAPAYLCRDRMLSASYE